MRNSPCSREPFFALFVMLAPLVGCGQSGPVLVDLNLSSAIPSAPPDTAIQIVSPTDTHGRIQMYGFGGDPIFGCDAAGGDPLNPQRIVDHQILCTWQARGWNGSTYAKSTVQIRAVASENWSEASKGTRLVISTTQRGTTVEDIRWQVSDAGHIEYKTTVPPRVSGCGSAPAVDQGSTDNAMRIRAGVGATECTVTFGAEWYSASNGEAYRPFCTAQNITIGAVLAQSNLTSSGVVIAGSVNGGDELILQCVGRV